MATGPVPPPSKRLLPQAGKKPPSTPTATRPVNAPSKVQRILGNPDTTLERVHVGIYDALDALVNATHAANVNITNVQTGNSGLLAYTTVSQGAGIAPQERVLDFSLAFSVADEPFPVSKTGIDLATLLTPGTFATPSSITVDKYGRISSITAGSGGSGITQLTSDVTAGPGSGSQVATLAQVGHVSVLPFNLAGQQNISKQGSGALLVGTSIGSTLNLYSNSITQLTLDAAGTQVQFPVGLLDITAIALPATPAAGHGRTWFDSTSLTLAGVNNAGTRSSMAFGSTAVAHQFLTAFSATTGAFTQAQPSFADLSGSLAGSQFGPLTGDVTTSLYVATLVNIPNSTTMAGSLLATNITAPVSPSGGHAQIYVDVSSFNLCCKNVGGVVNHAVQTRTATASNWIRSIADDGTIGISQPAFTDISGTLNLATQATGILPGSSLPAFTGDVTKPSASTVQTLANIPNSTPMAGSILATNIVAPVSPGGGHAQIYVDSTSTNLCAINTIGVVNHGIQSRTATAHNWISAINDDGTTGINQPAFADISGSVAASQMPALTGAVTTVAGAVATSIGNIPGRLKSFTVLTTGTAATYTRPTGITALIIELWGAGGGGGGVATSAAGKAGVGGGGGGGGYGRVYVASPTATMTYTVSAGGAAGANTGGIGGAGGTVSITDGTNTLSGGAGQGGQGLAVPAASSFLVGGGGFGTATLTGAGWQTLILAAGQHGLPGYVFGTATNLQWSGPGGDCSFGGAGSGPQTTAGNGGSGNTPGGGGSGGLNTASTTTAVTGGVGGAGKIIIWELTNV